MQPDRRGFIAGLFASSLLPLVAATPLGAKPLPYWAHLPAAPTGADIVKLARPVRESIYIFAHSPERIDMVPWAAAAQVGYGPVATTGDPIVADKLAAYIAKREAQG